MLEFFKILCCNNRELAYAFIIDGDSSHPYSVDELEDQLIDSNDPHAQSFLLKGQKMALAESTLGNQGRGLSLWLNPYTETSPDRIFFMYRENLPDTLELLKGLGWNI